MFLRDPSEDESPGATFEAVLHECRDRVLADAKLPFSLSPWEQRTVRTKLELAEVAEEIESLVDQFEEQTLQTGQSEIEGDVKPTAQDIDTREIEEILDAIAVTVALTEVRDGDEATERTLFMREVAEAFAVILQRRIESAIKLGDFDRSKAIHKTRGRLLSARNRLLKASVPQILDDELRALIRESEPHTDLDATMRTRRRQQIVKKVKHVLIPVTAGVGAIVLAGTLVLRVTSDAKRVGNGQVVENFIMLDAKEFEGRLPVIEAIKEANRMSIIVDDRWRKGTDATRQTSLRNLEQMLPRFNVATCKVMDASGILQAVCQSGQCEVASAEGARTWKKEATKVEQPGKVLP
jgi:hypothetical protein